MQTTTKTTASALAGIHAASIHGAHTHRTHYTKAMAFIQSHGWFAAITRDGLLALSTEFSALHASGEAFEGLDVIYEAPMVFEVDDAGMVSSREVREWLGY